MKLNWYIHNCLLPLQAGLTPVQNPCSLHCLLFEPYNMAIPVMEFSREGYKSKKGFWLKINWSQMKLMNFANWLNGEVSKSAEIFSIDCSEMKENDKWPFYDHFRPFFGNYMTIFHKTEVQTVFLRCLTASKLMKQNEKISISWFLQFCKKPSFVIIVAFFLFLFCVITFESIKI